MLSRHAGVFSSTLPSFLPSFFICSKQQHRMQVNSAMSRTARLIKAPTAALYTVNAMTIETQVITYKYINISDASKLHTKLGG